jgi:hypothetical protein
VTAGHLDHIIPRARGGPDAAWNKEVLHPLCNLAKGGRMTARAFRLAAERGISIIPLPDGAVSAALARALTALTISDRYVTELEHSAVADDPERISALLGDIHAAAAALRARVDDHESLDSVMSNTAERDLAS